MPTQVRSSWLHKESERTSYVVCCVNTWSLGWEFTAPLSWSFFDISTLPSLPQSPSFRLLIQQLTSSEYGKHCFLPLGLYRRSHTPWAPLLSFSNTLLWACIRMKPAERSRESSVSSVSPLLTLKMDTNNCLRTRPTLLRRDSTAQASECACSV